MTSFVNFWNEEWAIIAFENFEQPPHYEVSNYGRLRSFQGKSEGAIIQGSVIQGYRSLNVRIAGTKKVVNYYVHKLVAEHFVPQPSELHKYVVHLDFEKQNNRTENIKWVTREELRAHNSQNPAVINRRIPVRTKNYKLTASQVRVIKRMLQNKNNRLKMIAKQFGITHTQLNRIRAGENWKNVSLKN